MKDGSCEIKWRAQWNFLNDAGGAVVVLMSWESKTKLREKIAVKARNKSAKRVC